MNTGDGDYAALACLLGVAVYVIIAVIVLEIQDTYIARKRARASHRAALVARCDQQHEWVLAGDERGVCGDYYPVDINNPLAMQLHEVAQTVSDSDSMAALIPFLTTGPTTTIRLTPKQLGACNDDAKPVLALRQS